MSETIAEVLIIQEDTTKQRIDSKLILQNMAEVLHTVKKKHREKHRRKKEQKKFALLEGSDPQSSKYALALDNCSNFEKLKTCKGGDYKEEDSKNKKKVEKSMICDLDEVIVSDDSEDKYEDNNKRRKSMTNAFEIMMNARNRSLGSSESGKEVILSSPLSNECNKDTRFNPKNKIKLQELAEKVGSAKRRLDENARETYINRTLKRRAKRFKKMLLNGSTPQSNVTVISTEANSTVNKCLQKKDNEIVVDIETFDLEEQQCLVTLGSPIKKVDSLSDNFSKAQSNEINFKETKQEITSKNGRQRRKSENNEIVHNAEEQQNVKEFVSKKRGRSQKQKTINNAIHNTEEANVNTDKIIINRPRRSCTNKARYDCDIDISPTELAVKSSKNNKMRKMKNNTVPFVQSNDVVIDLDDNSTSSTLLISPKKLAPIFSCSNSRRNQKGVPKPRPDPEIVQARKAFLASGVPKKLRVEQEKQKIYEQQYEESLELFPKVTHVRQLSENELISQTLPIRVSYKLRDLEQITLANTLFKTNTNISRATLGQFSLLSSLTDSLVNDFQSKQTPLKLSRNQIMSNIHIPLPSLVNKREIIKLWKNDFGRFPTYKCYNQMREKYRHFNAMDTTQNTEQLSESFMVTRGYGRSLKVARRKCINIPGNIDDDDDDNYKPPIVAPNGELLFTEKYKPLLYEQILVNLNPVVQFRKFLSNWLKTPSTTKSHVKRDSKTISEMQSDDNSNSGSNSNLSQQSQFANALVLMGPISSGKTSSVFALANEMNFNVIEINAGMKRTGKRLLQELQEATQSHQIRKETSDGINGANFSQKQLLQLSMNGLKRKGKRQINSKLNKIHEKNSIHIEPAVNNSITEQESLPNELNLTSRKCLILIEDADIVFDQMDAGFIDAIYSLAISSKRPVILVASNPNCYHLQKLLIQNNCIQFHVPNVLNIVKFLAILSLMENCPIRLNDLISLYLYNRKDLRKTLLELQFFIQSGGDYHRNEGEVKNNSQYYASPRKRQFSIEQLEMQTNVIEGSNGDIPMQNDISEIPELFYTHHTLFDFYTINQNMKWCVPYPVDFELLSINISDLLQKATDGCDKVEQSSNNIFKLTRKSCLQSPKKQWLNNVINQSKNESQNFTLDHLFNFYDNLSIGEYINRNCKKTYQLKFQNDNEGLLPSSNDDITHCLVEKAIQVNLNMEFTSYNLYATSQESVTLSRDVQMNSTNARHLDYEPCLRAICRSEKLRCNRERRSTRFYHYLRNYITNLNDFSTELDEACHILYEPSTPISLDT